MTVNMNSIHIFACLHRLISLTLIRAFDPDAKNVIEFYSPLTLIVGKTNILFNKPMSLKKVTMDAVKLRSLNV